MPTWEKFDGRAILMALLHRFCNITQPEIGGLAGGIDYSAVSMARKRPGVKMETDEPLRMRFKYDKNFIYIVKGHHLSFLIGGLREAQSSNCLIP